MIPAASACSQASSISLFFPVFPDHKRSPYRFCAPATHSPYGTTSVFADSGSRFHARRDGWFLWRYEADPLHVVPSGAVRVTRWLSGPLVDLVAAALPLGH